MAEIVPVTSESLEAQVRNLLPSQRGFGEDLQASNVITPIIDLTPAAEGSNVSQNLQTARDFSQGSNALSAGTTTLISTTGFWQLNINLTYIPAAGNVVHTLRINDGSTTKTIWEVAEIPAGGEPILAADSFVVFLRAGDSLEAVIGGGALGNANYRQIATVNGTLVNPLGFTPQ